MASPLKAAIEALLIKREKVHREDPDRLLQDARGAQRAARDYRGRWLWELLQNCEPPAGQEKRGRARSPAQPYGRLCRRSGRSPAWPYPPHRRIKHTVTTTHKQG